MMDKEKFKKALGTSLTAKFKDEMEGAAEDILNYFFDISADLVEAAIIEDKQLEAELLDQLKALALAKQLYASNSVIDAIRSALSVAGGVALILIRGL